MLSLISALALFAPAFAQTSTGNSSASAVDIEAIQAHFTGAQLVPQLLEEFDPQATLSVSFGGQAITPGQNLAASGVGSAPDLTLNPGSNASDVSTDNRYTVMMIDANPVGTDESTTAQTRHWLVNGASLSGSAPYTVSYEGATSVTAYAGPGPAEGSGSHRYVLLVYLQPSSFSAPANLSEANTPLGTMFLSSYVSESGLGDVVAANYIQVENGQATISVASTSAVQTSTLAGFGSTTVASSTSGTFTNSNTAATRSGTAATSATSAASTTSKAAAPMTASIGMGKGAAIGLIGVAGTLLGAALGF